MDQTLDDLTDAQGGTERIKNTPMPKAVLLLSAVVRAYLLRAVAAGAGDQYGMVYAAGSTLVGFMFLALDKIGRDLEDPLHNTVYDIPLTSITTTIEVNLRQLLGETTVPKAEAPVDGVLW